jgi:hypothetical protein
MLFGRVVSLGWYYRCLLAYSDSSMMDLREPVMAAWDLCIVMWWTNKSQPSGGLVLIPRLAYDPWGTWLPQNTETTWRYLQRPWNRCLKAWMILPWGGTRRCNKSSWAFHKSFIGLRFNPLSLQIIRNIFAICMLCSVLHTSKKGVAAPYSYQNGPQSGSSPGHSRSLISTCLPVQLDWFIIGRAVCGLPVIYAPKDPLESVEKSIRESTFKVANLSWPLDLETPRALLSEESVSSIVEIHGRVVGCSAHNQRIPG